jgi:hypothetical protein
MSGQTGDASRALREEVEHLRELVDALRRENASLGADALRGRELADAIGEIPPGHFHSPYPSLDDVRRAARGWAKPPPDLPGLDLHVPEQLALVEEFARFREELPFPSQPDPAFRYWYASGVFGSGDAVVLYSMIRHLRPRRMIEVGSGFSSAVTLDTNDRFFDSAIECTFIEPDTARLRELLRPGDLERVVLREELVQDVPIEVFEALRANDILFIDSSHVAKAGSDVNYLLLEVLPRLDVGVHVHVHDIFYPFEYRRDWLVNYRWAWNEAYLLHAFLLHNADFEVRFFNNYLKLFHRDAIERALPAALKQAGGSIWLRRAHKTT